MKKLIPYPVASTALFVLWIALNQSFSLGHVLLGGIAAVFGGWTLAALDTPKLGFGRFSAIFQLVALVLLDIVRSNLAVARIVLGRTGGQRRSGFVDIPLELRHPYGLAMLACIITSTPGTLWVAFDSRKGILTVHVLDLINDTDWINTIKGRYERPLLEIFASLASSLGR